MSRIDLPSVWHDQGVNLRPTYPEEALTTKLSGPVS